MFVSSSGAFRWLRCSSRRRLPPPIGCPGRRRKQEPDDAAQTLEWTERLEWLGLLLPELSPTERSLLVERFGNGKTLAAAGAAVGLSGNAAHGRLRRLIARLRLRAQERFHEE